MDSSQKEAIKQRIHSELPDTKEQIDRLKKLVKPISPDIAVGRLSRMEAIATKSVNEAALATATQKLAGLQTALANLDEPEFGICFECGKDIPIGRILLLPESKMCVSCAESFE